MRSPARNTGQQGTRWTDSIGVRKAGHPGAQGAGPPPFRRLRGDWRLPGGAAGLRRPVPTVPYAETLPGDLPRTCLPTENRCRVGPRPLHILPFKGSRRAPPGGVCGSASRGRAWADPAPGWPRPRPSPPLCEPLAPGPRPRRPGPAPSRPPLAHFRPPPLPLARQEGSAEGRNNSRHLVCVLGRGERGSGPAGQRDAGLRADCGSRSAEGRRAGERRQGPRQ